jgi:hypothetical protein
MRASGAFVFAFVVVLVPLVARADVGGSYKRVGDWAYDQDRSKSCGSEVRKAFTQILSFARSFTVTKTEVLTKFASEKRFDIKKRERGHIEAEHDASDRDTRSIWTLHITETKSETQIVFVRNGGTMDGREVCVDSWRTSATASQD